MFAKLCCSFKLYKYKLWSAKLDPVVFVTYDTEKNEQRNVDISHYAETCLNLQNEYINDTLGLACNHLVMQGFINNVPSLIHLRADLINIRFEGWVKLQTIFCFSD